MNEQGGALDRADEVAPRCDRQQRCSRDSDLLLCGHPHRQFRFGPGSVLLCAELRELVDAHAVELLKVGDDIIDPKTGIGDARLVIRRETFDDLLTTDLG